MIILKSLFILFLLFIPARYESGVTATDNQIVTADGNVWIYESNLPENTNVLVQFDDKGTENKTDDIITAVFVQAF